MTRVNPALTTRRSKKHTGWSYWNGNVWIRLGRGQLGRIRGLGYKVRRDV